MFTGDISQSEDGASPSNEVIVAVEGLTKRYGRRVALEALSLTVRRGEVFGLVGANGGGKTTTLRILAGILKPDQGRGQVLGFDLLRGANDIRRHVGYMSQRFSLYPDLTVIENLRFRAEIYGLQEMRTAVEQALEHFELARYARTRARELSGGWARKLQLAATLIHSPQLIFLDEPTAGLDTLSRHDVWRRLERLASAGAGVIVSSHDLAKAERCSRAALLREGRVVDAGTPDQIAQRAPAVAFLLSGSDARALQGTIEHTAGVITSYPQGGGLRVVAMPESATALTNQASAHHLSISKVLMRLEDAVLACSTRP